MRPERTCQRELVLCGDVEDDRQCLGRGRVTPVSSIPWRVLILFSKVLEELRPFLRSPTVVRVSMSTCTNKLVGAY